MCDNVQASVKPWYTSKMMWFNILTTLGAVAGGVVGVLPTLQPLLTPTSYAVTMFVVGVVNIGLRAVTQHGITFKA